MPGPGRNGLTLIELLLVVMILAVLVGGALPFVQQYVEDSRLSRCKQDLDEIRQALIRYEIDHPGMLYTASDISLLVGPYLSKGMSDPWGNPYVVDSAKSTCFSPGPDHQSGTADDLSMDFRPPLAIAKAFYEDTNRNFKVDTGDRLIVKFTRPVRQLPGDGPRLTIADDDFVYSAGQPASDYSARVFDANAMKVGMTLDFGGNPPFRVGLDTIAAKPSNKIVDQAGFPCRSGQNVIIQALQ
jgi:prepilin-type N-terminal cleavage/methylation domain-containing protein